MRNISLPSGFWQTKALAVLHKDGFQEVAVGLLLEITAQVEFKWVL